ncbi:MAG: hypothetical protein Q8P15_03935 [Nanoarchaeota archaeon]|nr:hypothetical protein [Nanoarchaeota archaeon]
MCDQNILNKKGQIGETMTWIVATIIIITILGISIFATQFIINPDKKITFSEDKEKNLLAIKSITSFLKNEKNVELLRNKDYVNFEKEVKVLLETLPDPSVGSAGDWNFELYENDEKKIEVHNYRLATNIGQYNHFENNFLFEQTKLRFWLECQGICK